mgnify:FL=1
MGLIKKTQGQRSPLSHSFEAAKAIVSLSFRDLSNSDADIRLESAQFLMGKTLKPFTDILRVSESEIQALAKMALKEDVGARRKAAAKEASRKFTALCERSQSTSSTKL